MSENFESYMDEIIYTDINISFENKNELFESLSQFYKLHELTKKWHKNDYYEEIKLSDAMTENLEKLKNYYINCYSAIDNFKIVRLNKSNEEKLSNYEHLLYLKELRRYDDVNKLSNLSRKQQEKYNPFLRKIMILSRISSKIKVRIINKKLPINPTNKPIIFVLSHVGRDDQIIFNEAIKEHYTILSGDYESLHNNIEGFITNLNGVIFFDMNSKEERKKVIDRVSEKLKEGDNILCSMEGAWNLSANSIVNKLFSGMINASLVSGALILPVAIERFNSKLYSINVGTKYFNPSDYFKYNEKNKENIESYTEKIRQNLADLKYQTYYDEYIYSKIFTKRATLGNFDEVNEEFKKDILKGWTFDENDIKRKGYQDKQNPTNVFKYVVQFFVSKFNCKSEMTSEQFALLLNKLKSEINNNIYPNEIHNQLIEIYNLQINSQKHVKQK